MNPYSHQAVVRKLNIHCDKCRVHHPMRWGARRYHRLWNPVWLAVHQSLISSDRFTRSAASVHTEPDSRYRLR